jgi:glycerol-1-phosphate dehydrogenase [NAD(P)+]
MAVKIEYEGEKLLPPIVDCDCGLTHGVPDIDIYIGSNIAGNCACYIGRRKLGIHAVLVADRTTYEIAGKLVEKRLTEAGYKISLCRLEREGRLEPDEAALGEVLLAVGKNTDFLVAVGSGSITDLTRYVAVNTGKPFVSVGTAASMDGYTSVVAPLLNRGLKVNRPATYPKILICDLEIMRGAPYPMTLSGFGDVLGKYIAIADWKLGEIINGETYCPAVVEIVTVAVQKCIDNIEEIKNRTAAGVQSLIEALILTGLTILVIGHTRSVASVEHNMAHYWEMMQLLRRETPPSHGAAVGVATGYVTRWIEEFFKLDFSAIDRKAIAAKRLSRKAREELLKQKYGTQFGLAIIKENSGDFIPWEEQERRIDAFLSNYDAVREAFRIVPQWPELKAIYREVGAPCSAAELGIDRGLLEDALLWAKDYRLRYTLFKTAAEFGVLEDLVAKVMAGEE